MNSKKSYINPIVKESCAKLRMGLLAGSNADGQHQIPFSPDTKTDSYNESNLRIPSEALSGLGVD